MCLSHPLGCPSSYLNPDLNSFSDSTRTILETCNHLPQVPRSRVSCVGNSAPNDSRSRSRSPRAYCLLWLRLTGPAYVPALCDAAHPASSVPDLVLSAVPLPRLRTVPFLQVPFLFYPDRSNGFLLGFLIRSLVLSQVMLLRAAAVNF